MSKSKVIFYEVRLSELYPESINENYKLVSTSQKATPWLTAFLVPNETIIESLLYIMLHLKILNQLKQCTNGLKNQA